MEGGQPQNQICCLGHTRYGEGGGPGEGIVGGEGWGEGIYGDKDNGKLYLLPTNWNGDDVPRI